MKKKRLIISSMIGCLAVATVAGCIWYKKETRIEEKKDIVLEFGDSISNQPERYAEIGKLVKRNVTLDTSEVDTNKEGKYKVTIKSGKREKEIWVTVKDTKKPEIKLKQNSFIVKVGQELKAMDIVESIRDKSGIKSVVFEKNMKNQEQIVIDENGVPDSVLVYEEEGKFKNAVIAIDNNGVGRKLPFEVNVGADYTLHVFGIQDITVDVGKTVDWMAGITFDERVKEVQVDASTVNLNIAGQYSVKYIIIGDDDSKAEVVKSVTVNKKKSLTSQEVKQLILKYYNGLSGDDGVYVISDAAGEFQETDAGYNAIIRYQMSDEEANAMIASGRMPSANILYTVVNVSKDTWLATDDLGNGWYLM